MMMPYVCKIVPLLINSATALKCIEIYSIKIATIKNTFFEFTFSRWNRSIRDLRFAISNVKEAILNRRLAWEIS